MLFIVCLYGSGAGLLLTIRCTRTEVLPFLTAYLHSGLAFSTAGSNFCQAKMKQKFTFPGFMYNKNLLRHAHWRLPIPYMETWLYH